MKRDTNGSKIFEGIVPAWIVREEIAPEESEDVGGGELDDLDISAHLSPLDSRVDFWFWTFTLLFFSVYCQGLEGWPHLLKYS